MRNLFGIAALVVVSLSAVACSSAPIDDTGTADEAELRALGTSEVVGDITYGTDSMEVQNPGDDGPRKVYRAVRFQGTAGDEITATAIGGNAADPVVV